MFARLKECSDLRKILWQEMEPNKNEHQGRHDKNMERCDNQPACLAFRHSRREFVMYFEVYVMATEFRRKMLATAAPHFLGTSFLTAVHQKNSNETATKGKLNKMKSRIGTRDDSVAATCGQSPAGRREGKASM
jgi:hypothetical protein